MYAYASESDTINLQFSIFNFQFRLVRGRPLDGYRPLAGFF
ncbi:hypothetical protein D1AOALGA4SA_5461 [Olavius algarvensis Delta 1 endosymbiont]|nr:hypothetical protein D1AOALGA4SA_5461 [Olavius algarvensis Delta 1 endosymbiont]